MQACDGGREEGEEKWVYDYVNPIYKAGAQRTCYMNTVHLMEMPDNGHVDNRMGYVAGREAVMRVRGWHVNRCILPPKARENMSRGASNVVTSGTTRTLVEIRGRTLMPTTRGMWLLLRICWGGNYPHCS